MRITYISSGNIPSKFAHTFQVMQMAEALAGQASSLELLTARGLFADVAAKVDLKEWYGLHRELKVVRLPVFLRLSNRFFSDWSYPRFDRSAALYTRLRSPDLVYTRSSHAGRLCVRLRLRTVIEYHSDTADPDFRHVLKAARSRHLAAVVTQSDDLKSTFVEAGIPASKVLAWPNAADLATFARPAELPPSPYDSNQANIAYVGHLYEYKGIPSILEAAALLPSIQFHLVGGWREDVAAQRKVIAERKLANVVLHGMKPRAQVPPFLWHADVLLLPPSNRKGRQPGISLKAGEYLASGTPVIATSIPAITNWLSEDQVLLVPSDDGRALAEAITRLLRDGDKQAALSDRAEHWARDHSYEHRARAVLRRLELPMRSSYHEGHTGHPNQISQLR